MAQLSYINTGVKQTPDLTFNIPTDESVGAFYLTQAGLISRLSHSHCYITISKMARFSVSKIWMMHSCLV